MMHIDLSALDSQELRRLLDASRQRGNDALTDQILKELADRHSRPAEPRSLSDDDAWVAPDLGEPDWGDPPVDEEPLALPARPVPKRRGRRAAQAAPPELGFTDDPAPAGVADALDLRLDDERPARPRARQRRARRTWIAVAVVVGVGLGIGLGWWVAAMIRDGLAPPKLRLAVAPPSAAQVAATAIGQPAATPSPTPTAPPAPVPESAPSSPPAETAIPAPEPAPPPPEPVKPKPAAAQKPAPHQAPAAKPAPHKPPAAKAEHGCAAQPTPADRVLCADPKLRRLQQDVQKAYARALAAHPDHAALRQHQLAWRDARSNITDRARLERLYRERLRKLTAVEATKHHH